MENFAIVIHGGAQNKDPQTFSPEKNAAYKEALNEALTAGWQLLAEGRSALDAVERAVISLENSTLFNAGRGSVLNAKGDLEFDSAIMCGHTLNAGAVAGVKYVKNPVRLARAVMDYSEHVFLCGRGAEEFAGIHNIEFEDRDYFITPERVSEWKQGNKDKKEAGDTVGAVALDKSGNLAAASSTGGLPGKLVGRVGDTPLIGCGTYANNETCAVACTGDGELIMRGVYAHEIHALIRYKKLSLNEALNEVFDYNTIHLKAEMGIIAIGPQCNIALKYNTLPMYRAFKKNDEPAYIAVWND